MTVYVIADIKVTDDGWIPAYAASVHELVHKHGGKYLSRSGNVKTLEGKPLDTTQEGYYGAGHDKWHQGFYSQLRRNDGGSCSPQRSHKKTRKPRRRVRPAIPAVRW